MSAQRVIKFWEQIADDLAKENDNHHPKNWTESEINTFAIAFEERLLKNFSRDKEKARLCRAEWQGGKKYHFKVFDTTTFRRIFQYKKSSGKIGRRNRFAVYLGYNSYDEYLLKNKITEFVPQNKEELNGIQVEQKELFNQPNSRKAFLKWYLLIPILVILFTLFFLLNNSQKNTPIAYFSIAEDTVSNKKNTPNPKEDIIKEANNNKETDLPRHKVNSKFEEIKTPNDTFETWICQGKVVNTTNQQIQNATISIGELSTQTNEQGMFKFELKNLTSTSNDYLIIKACTPDSCQDNQKKVFDENDIIFIFNK